LYSPFLEYEVAVVYQLAHELIGHRVLLLLLFTLNEQGAEYGSNATWSKMVTLGPVTVLVKTAKESQKMAQHAYVGVR
jgi:hypothetical protein